MEQQYPSLRVGFLSWRPATNLVTHFLLLSPCCGHERQIYVHSTQSHDSPHLPQPLRLHSRCCDSFHSRWFVSLLAGMGLHGHLFPPPADYLGLFPEARSPTSCAPLASTALRSWWALPVSLLVIPLIALRLIHEEKMLRRDLPGYSDYCLRTRSRLLPLLW